MSRRKTWQYLKDLKPEILLDNVRELFCTTRKLRDSVTNIIELCAFGEVTGVYCKNPTKPICRKPQDSLNAYSKLCPKWGLKIMRLLLKECKTWKYFSVQCSPISTTTFRFLEKGGDQLDRSCEKWKGVTWSKGRGEIVPVIRRRNGKWIGHILHRNCFLKQAFEGKVDGRILVTGKLEGRRG